MVESIHTLPQDIYALFEKPHEVSSTRLEELKESLGSVVKEALESAGKPSDFTLRMSNIGLGNRKLWFESRDPDYGLHSGETYFKFLYGHLLEALVIFLAKEAGHDVQDEQKEVELDGVLGHMDGVIDGVTSDVKSASPYAYNKFINGNINSTDSFGYRHQLSGYYESTDPETSEVAWVVINKATGEIGVTSYESFELPKASTKIALAKAALEKDTPPEERCYVEEKDNYGNTLMPKPCTFCKYKDKCWNYDAFKYSNGPKYITNLVKKPRVDLIKSNRLEQ